MTIKTKYKINDAVWVIYQNKPELCRVYKVDIFVGDNAHSHSVYASSVKADSPKQQIDYYLCKNGTTNILLVLSDNNHEPMKFKSNMLFKTKQTLLKSL